MEYGAFVFSGDPGFAGDGAGHRSSSKIPPNSMKYIWFSSFFHKEFKYVNSFSRILVENQKRREKDSKSKTQKHDSGQIKQN
jgi:hypothetical protein